MALYGEVVSRHREQLASERNDSSEAGADGAFSLLFSFREASSISHLSILAISSTQRNHREVVGCIRARLTRSQRQRRSEFRPVTPFRRRWLQVNRVWFVANGNLQVGKTLPPILRKRFTTFIAPKPRKQRWTNWVGRVLGASADRGFDGLSATPWSSSFVWDPAAARAIFSGAPPTKK
jgi:hypothetical protein